MQRSYYDLDGLELLKKLRQCNEIGLENLLVLRLILILVIERNFKSIHH